MEAKRKKTGSCTSAFIGGFPTGNLRQIIKLDVIAMWEPTAKELTELCQLEEELWRSETRFDQCRMRQIISEDFAEFGKSGRIYSRDGVLAIERQPIHAVIPLPNFRVRLLSLDVAQVTYDSITTDNGVTSRAHRSSIWSRTKSGWRLRFHQGTPFEEHT